ncbi:MAG: hypothetical protein HQ553_00710 [Chloroflexi bacterium]|nr:hypothetical protein [Chloroflexota bacterium]
MARDYTHLVKQGEEIGWEIRYYSASESTFEHNGKQVLLVEVEAAGCSFCDGSYAQSLMGANVEGYIVEWKYKEDDEGQSVSLIEPIRDAVNQKEIAAILKPRYARSQINFC